MPVIAPYGVFTVTLRRGRIQRSSVDRRKPSAVVSRKMISAKFLSIACLALHL